MPGKESHAVIVQLGTTQAPWKKLAHEKPKGETIAYDNLLNAWKNVKVR